MNPIHRRPDRYGVVMTLVIVLSVWTVNLLGVLRFADNYISDLASAFAARSYAPNDLLMVYTPRQLLRSDDGQLVDLVKQINAANPAKIAILHAVSPQQTAQLAALPYASKIITGYRYNDLEADQTVSQKSDPTLAKGYLDLHLDGQAVYRNHFFKRQSPGDADSLAKTHWSIEAEIARQAIGQETANAIPARPVGVRFFGGVSGLPHVDSSAILAGDVIPEMVSQRVVLIGPQSNHELGFVTPTTRGAQRMSELELHANLLQTLLHNNYLVRLTPLGSLAVIFLVPLVCVHCFRNRANRWMIRSWLAFSFGVAALCWTCLSLWSVLMPASAMLLAVALSFVSVLYLRFRALKDLVDNWRLLRSSSQPAKLRAIDGNRWTAMADSVVEVFDPRRVVLMRLDPGSTHLKIAELRECDADDIREQRRDVHRFPFREAIEQNYPTEIEDRRFLNEVDDQGRELMVPLVMLSEVIGFMVIEMDADALQRWGDFESCLARYASDMAIFLAGTRDEDELVDNNDLVRQPSRALPEQNMAASLIKDEVQHRSFGKMLDSTIDSAETAIAIGDVFGQLVKVNEKMIGLLQRDDVSTQDIGCVAVLSKLTQRDEAECRKLFRRCIIEDRSEQVVLASKSANESSSVLFIRPLSHRELEHQRGIDSRFVAIEIVSGEVFDAINHWQRQFLAAQSDQIDRQMDLLLQIAGDLEVVRREGGSRTDPYVAMARDVLSSINEVRAAVGNNLTDSPSDHFLMDTQPILSAALRSSDDDLTQYGVTVRKTFDHAESIANANPFLLEQVFATIIDCLVTDCDEETQLVIGCEQDDRTVRYQFSTQTNPIETTELERCLFGTTEKDRVMLAPSEDALVTQRHLDRLRESNRWLAKWGAKLSIQCDAFYRVSISLTLLSTATIDQESIDPVPSEAALPSGAR